ncbi:hypothetical protein EVAR_53765_1 [Eumeta japonica]|uniref:Uncharacterized protein n=1 Tax=Eumeta variegata TaxID=151549 RepID=A0A4C1Z6N2_EUMVA|nr:hypothetical protein EVAR_53765_1 [Eumeta japonica]
MFQSHINIECWDSVKTIKYVCKYANKESDMAVFQTAKDNDQQNSEILVYQMGRYIDSDEAAWRSFGFPIQEREPFVQHLALHLENGQRIYFKRYRHKDWK